MSVIMTLRMKGDPNKLEEIASADPDRIRSITEASKQHGVIAHRFYASEDGDIMVIDEWPDAESFQRFFGEQQGNIGPLMQDAGISGEPRPEFWRKLETRDEVGWGA